MYQKRFVKQVVMKIDNLIYDKLNKKVQEDRKMGMRVFTADIVRSIFHISKDAGFVPKGEKQVIDKRMGYPQCKIWLDNEEYDYLCEMKKKILTDKKVYITFGDLLMEYVSYFFKK